MNYKQLKGELNILLFLLIVIFGVFGAFVFKNIQYPLMWGDEADTALFGKQILNYGYPKVHDGKNTLNSNLISGNVGVLKKYDLVTAGMWGQYYYAAIGEYFAKKSSDFYTKTAILRSSFALIGTVGVFILPLIFLILFKGDKRKKLLSFLFYTLIQLFSISLILHLREVRSYSLAIFLSSLAVLIFYVYYFIHRIQYFWYTVFLFIVLFLLANTSPPSFLAIICSFSAYIFINNFLKNPRTFLEKTFTRENLKTLAPLFFAILCYLPILKFFNISQTTNRAYIDMNYNFSVYLAYFFRMLSFFAKYHLLYVAIYLKIVNFFLAKKFNQLKEVYKYQKLSQFLTLIFLVFLFTVPIMPFIFDRYYIFLQPLLSAIIIIDLFSLIEYYGLNEKDAKNRLGVHLYIVLFLFTIAQITNFDNISGHIYEMTHQYEGPLDKVIFYIKRKYSHPENLTIYTQIEQLPLIYYLNSYVMCDENDNCYEDPPDIFIPRNYALSETWYTRYNKYLSETNYIKVGLSILDYPVNNIPEFSLSLRHLYKTPIETDPNRMLYLFVKKD